MYSIIFPETFTLSITMNRKEVKRTQARAKKKKKGMSKRIPFDFPANHPFATTVNR